MKKIKIKKKYFGIFLLMFFGFCLVAHAENSFLRNLKVGDSGQDVLLLQKMLNSDPETRVSSLGLGSSGQETQYFGLKTKLAVVRFQEKYRQEVLFPANLSSGTGFVGSLTRAKLTFLSNNEVSSNSPSSVSSPNAQNTQINQLVSQKVTINDFFPKRVKVGETITITGTGFTATGNDIMLRFGILEQKVTNVPSSDRKTLTFVYDPPNPAPKSDFSDISLDVLSGVKANLEANGASLSDISNPYKGISSEAELEIALKKQGKTLSDLDSPYTVIVSNKNGEVASAIGAIKGARKFAFGTNTGTVSKNKSYFDSFISKVEEVFDFSPKTVFAQVPGGGFTTFFTYCTCGPGYLTLVVGVPGTPSGLYYFSPATIYWVGTGLGSANYLSLYTPGAGFCSMNAATACYVIPGNLMNYYGGSL